MCSFQCNSLICFSCNRFNGKMARFNFHVDASCDRTLWSCTKRNISKRKTVTKFLNFHLFLLWWQLTKRSLHLKTYTVQQTNCERQSEILIIWLNLGVYEKCLSKNIVIFRWQNRLVCKNTHKCFSTAIYTHSMRTVYCATCHRIHYQFIKVKRKWW